MPFSSQPNAFRTESPVINFLTNKRWGIVRHLIFIIVFFAQFGFLDAEETQFFADTIKIPFRILLLGNLVTAIIGLAVIYVNAYVLFYRYLLKEKYGMYILWVLIFLVIFFVVNISVQQVWVKYYGKPEKFTTPISILGFISTVMFPLIFLCATTGYKLFKNWIYDQQRFANLQKEKLNTELAQLKNQVNPHFLFNTLNNLHVLTKNNPDKASQIILGLSDVLRYQIYDSQHDEVLLSKDIEIIEQYVELEKIRRSHLNVSIKVEGTLSGILVPPLLFINFVDNAIKHSASSGESFINILFKVEGGQLYFTIVNSKPTHKINVENGKMGLVNVTKRLALLYGTAHTLSLDDQPQQYTVKLTIPL
jgi:sensor histidine kinase YesM